ncbi:Hypothetical_protein [Hexamita inflata]|uniref:Hypothetical_protein n=1 Tax=Hexamita inflata TaxID=28002 RepID=A0AA86QYI8_9EUKA|nr:Hypothetical protein HINF_LOCUS49823 [Hexamita inflata]
MRLLVQRYVQDNPTQNPKQFPTDGVEPSTGRQLHFYSRPLYQLSQVGTTVFRFMSNVYQRTNTKIKNEQHDELGYQLNIAVYDTQQLQVVIYQQLYMDDKQALPNKYYITSLSRGQPFHLQGGYHFQPPYK